MCDDGTNQCSSHGRMAGYEQLPNGNIRLLFKSNISSIALQQGWDGGTCVLFKQGDNVYLYRSNGRLVCDTTALSDSVEVGKQVNAYGKTETIYAVEIPRGSLHLDAIEGVDLSSSSPSVGKICVDNRTYYSSGFLFDNCKVQNIRSRGLLIKGCSGTIQYCSLISTGMAGINVGQELEWGESGISQNVKLLYNYIENSGHYGDAPKNAAIYVHSVAKSIDPDYLNLMNVEIIGNKIVGRNTTYAIFVSGVQKLVIRDNDFGSRRGVENDTAPAVRLEYVNDVLVEGNVYPAACTEVTDRVSAIYYTGIHGADVESYPADEMTSGYADVYEEYAPSWDEQGRVSYHGNWTVGCVGF